MWEGNAGYNGIVGAPLDGIPPAVEQAMVVTVPLLMDLVCRTKNLSVRSAALLALSRMAFNAASAR